MRANLPEHTGRVGTDDSKKKSVASALTTAIRSAMAAEKKEVPNALPVAVVLVRRSCAAANACLITMSPA